MDDRPDHSRQRWLHHQVTLCVGGASAIDNATRRLFHDVHAVLAGGIIATAVGNDLVLAHPHDGLKSACALTLSGGPAIYLLGSAVYKKAVYGVVPASHRAGVAALLALISVAPTVDLLTMGWLTTIVMLAVGFWEERLVRKRREAGEPQALTR